MYFCLLCDISLPITKLPGNSMVGAAAERLTGALSVAGSISVQNKYLYKFLFDGTNICMAYRFQVGLTYK